MARTWLQLAFEFRLRALVCDRDDEFDFPEHRLTTGDAPAPETTAPISIFDLAARVAKVARGRGAARFKAAPAAAGPKATVVRSDGVTVCIGAQYPANRWDDEKIERERVRRAKQRPPKPTRKAKTKGRKLLDLIGTDNDRDDL